MTSSTSLSRGGVQRQGSSVAAAADKNDSPGQDYKIEMIKFSGSDEEKGEEEEEEEGVEAGRGEEREMECECDYAVEALSESCISLLEVFDETLWLIIWCSCWFFALLTFDVAADDVVSVLLYVLLVFL